MNGEPGRTPKGRKGGREGEKGRTVRPQQRVHGDELEVIAVMAHDGLDEELVAHHALAG